MKFIHETNRIYYANADGKTLAEITFPNINETTVVIDHTFVDESLRGQGIANQLMAEAVHFLQKNKKKIEPVCSYAVSWFQKHPEYAETIARR